MYPEHDDQFEETTIAKVEHVKNGGWGIERADGWYFHVPGDSSVEPKEGMTARFYGGGVGHVVRGLFLDGTKVYYRNKAEESDHHERQTYGADAPEWLARWDAGSIVWTVEMGGLGPGYEQCIAISTAEILRHMLEAKYDAQRWQIPELWKDDREAIEKAGFANPVIDQLGLSGAQWGAAMNVATNLYRLGPIECLTDSRVKDRLIQVSKRFPQAVAV